MSHQQQPQKPALCAYLWAVHPSASLLLTLCEPVSSSSTFQQRHYRSRQLVLSGQLCPFISLPGTAVIKQNEETGSNSEAENHSSVSFASFRSFLLPASVSATSSSLFFHPSLLSVSIYTLLGLILTHLSGDDGAEASVKVYCWGSSILHSLLLHVCVCALRWISGYQQGDLKGSLRESPKKWRFICCHLRKITVVLIWKQQKLGFYIGKIGNCWSWLKGELVTVEERLWLKKTMVTGGRRRKSHPGVWCRNKLSFLPQLPFNFLHNMKMLSCCSDVICKDRTVSKIGRQLSIICENLTISPQPAVHCGLNWLSDFSWSLHTLRFVPWHISSHIRGEMWCKECLHCALCSLLFSKTTFGRRATQSKSWDLQKALARLQSEP